MEDYAMPNDTWSKKSIELFNELNKLTKEGKGWLKLSSNPTNSLGDGTRHFLRPLEEKGKIIECAFFCNPSLCSLKGVVQFGIYTRGYIGYVHGGAISSILDSAMGACAEVCKSPAFTANMNIDFKGVIPLNSTALVEATIDKVEGRKIFTSAILKTTDGNVTYTKCTGLFITQKRSGL